jgi:hypothetical protein
MRKQISTSSILLSQTSQIWHYRRDGLWWEWPYKRGATLLISIKDHFLNLLKGDPLYQPDTNNYFKRIV